MGIRAGVGAALDKSLPSPREAASIEVAAEVTGINRSLTAEDQAWAKSLGWKHYESVIRGYRGASITPKKRCEQGSSFARSRS
jgi:hypothetical protein